MSTFIVTAYDRLVKDRRAMVFNGRRQAERYEDEMTARRDARLIASNPRYTEVRVEPAE